MNIKIYLAISASFRHGDSGNYRRGNLLLVGAVAVGSPRGRTSFVANNRPSRWPISHFARVICGFTSHRPAMPYYIQSGIFRSDQLNGSDTLLRTPLLLLHTYACMLHMMMHRLSAGAHAAILIYCALCARARTGWNCKEF